MVTSEAGPRRTPPHHARFVLQTIWSIDLTRFDVDVADIAPVEGASRLEVPGPRRRLRRPYLDACIGPGGLVARIVGGNGQARPLVLVGAGTPNALPLPVPPLAASARGDHG